MKLYAIKDKIANEFGPIQQCKNDAVALRMYQSSLKDVNPEEFSLYQVGEIDTETGEIQPGLFLVEITLKTEVEEDE